MTPVEISYIFSEYYKSEFLDFGRIEKKLANRAFVHAIRLLDRLVPNNQLFDNRNFIDTCNSGQIYFNVGVATLSKVEDLTKSIISDLVRCGVKPIGLHQTLTLIL